MFAFTGEAASAGTLSPPPQEVKITGAPMLLSLDVGIETSAALPALAFVATSLGADLAGGGFSVSGGPASGHALAVRFQRSADPPPSGGLPPEVTRFTAIGDEGYLLSVTPSGPGLRILVLADDVRGLWNGAMTLRQLLLTDTGTAEPTLAPQRIRDYAARPVRGAVPYGFEFTQVDGGGSYIVSPQQLDILDELARHKVNFVFFPTGTLATDAGEWAQARTGLAALQRAAADRQIELVPTIGSLQSDWAPAYRDGWWVREEPMHFSAATQEAEPDDDPLAGRRSGNLVTNGDFESASAGTPTAWTLGGVGASGATFTRDSTVHAVGAHSMRLDATGGNAAVTLGQHVTGPLAAGHYLVSARIRTQGVSGNRPKLAARAIFGGQPLSPSRYLSPLIGSYDWDRWQGFLRIPHGQTAERIEIAASWDLGAGSVWFDDVQLRRTDADLRNLLRQAYDVRVTSADRSVTYAAGVDYNVVEGTFGNVYAPELTATRLVRTAGSAIPTGTRVLVSYDANLFSGVRIDAAPTQTSLAGEQGLNLCTPHALVQLYQPALARLLWDFPTLNPDLPLRAISLNGDEIRGFNRSGACRNPDGSLSATNAQRLTAFFQQIINHAKLISPSIAFFAYGDMFSPAHNGGVPSYQVDLGNPVFLGRDLGGAPGMTYCSLAPAGPGCVGQGPANALGPEVHFISWWPGVQTLFQKYFEARFFESIGRGFVVSAPSDPGPTGWDQTIRDTAAIAAGNPYAFGVIHAHDTRPGSLALGASLAWNGEWKQVFYEPFEFAFHSLWGFEADRPVQADYALTNASILANETCASPVLFEPDVDKSLPATNAGGVCVGSGGGSLRLPHLPVDSSLGYRVSFQSRASTALAGTLRLRWQTVRGEERLEDVPIQIGGTSGGWVRSAADIAPWKAPGDPIVRGVSIEILAPAWARIDDFMLWEEQPGCPDGDVVPWVPPVNVTSRGTDSGLSFTLAISNLGCRDLEIVGIGSTPEAFLETSLVDPLPIVVRKGTTDPVQISGRTPGGVPVPGPLGVWLQTNAPGSPIVWVDVTLQPAPACGLLGIEPLAALAAFAWRRRLSLRRGRRNAAGSGARPDVRGCVG